MPYANAGPWDVVRTQRCTQGCPAYVHAHVFVVRHLDERGTLTRGSVFIGLLTLVFMLTVNSTTPLGLICCECVCVHTYITQAAVCVCVCVGEAVALTSSLLSGVFYLTQSDRSSVGSDSRKQPRSETLRRSAGAARAAELRDGLPELCLQGGVVVTGTLIAVKLLVRKTPNKGGAES